jgi:uncharacterized protein involved in exopolysaccharide biosynthesis
MVGQTRALLEWAKLHFRTLTLITAACTVIGIVVALLLPVSYMAEAILLPPGDGGTVRPGLLSQLSAFTGAIAVSPLASFGPLYPDIARSRVVLLPVLDREFEGHTYREWFGEAKALSPTEEEKLYLDLRKHVTGYVNPLTSLITLEATAPRPELAAGFLNEVLARMDVFFQTRLVTEAREQRLALERRLEELERSLKNSEEALEKFLMANRQPQLSPNVELTESRLRREVTINSSMYTELKQQYELTRIKEIGSTPALKVLSAPTPPLHRSAPRRSLIVILATALGGMLALGIVRIREMWSEDATVRQ